jgi:DNA-binding NarL/FixJ family response regulator
MDSSQRSLKVFIVEDSAIMSTLLERMLAQEPDIELVGTVATAADAIAAIESLRPDLTVLDLLLAAGNGFEVLQALRAVPGQRPNVLVLTNLAGDVYRQRAMDLGATDFFDKSTEIPVMLELIRGLAERRNSRHGSKPPPHGHTDA